MSRRSTQPSEIDLERLLKVTKALGDGNRLRMVQLIAERGELSCGEVAESFSIAQATVSHHLKILVDSGLVDVRREGQFAYFSLNRTVLEAGLSCLRQLTRHDRRR